MYKKIYYFLLIMIDGFYTFIGMAGCGKTSLAEYLNKKFNITFVDTDRLIEMHESMVLEDIKKKNGYMYIRKIEEEIIMSLSNSQKIISTGGSAVYSNKAMNYLSSISKIIFINTSLEIIKERIGINPERGLASPSGESIDNIFMERLPLYRKWSDIEINGNQTISDLAEELLNKL
tara:strand:- start:493 stop:1020 length:528 start_codon:yes stop_codon:yes gene_type:complete